MPTVKYKRISGVRYGGHTKGVKHSNETRNNIKEGIKKKYPNGRKISEKTRKIMSINVALRHKLGGFKNKYKKGEGYWMNKRRPEVSGTNHYLWKGGPNSESQKIRKSIEYKLWRKAVFERDSYTCVWCGDKGILHADHIKPFAYFPELRFAIDNGRTLCKECHSKTDTYLWKGIKSYETTE